MTAAAINNEGEMKMWKAKAAAIIDKSLKKHSKLFGGEMQFLKSKAATIDKRLKKHPELLSGEVRSLKAMAAIVDEKLKKHQKLLSGKLESCDEDLAANWGNKEHELMKYDIDFVDFEKKRARAAKRQRSKSAASVRWYW